MLLLHDETDARLQFVKWLAADGYRCLTAEDPATALAVIGHTTTDVAIIDIGREAHAGFWLAQRLRERTTPTGVVFVSRRDSVDGAALMRMGASDYLVNPSTPEELLTAVERAAEWRNDEEARALDARTRIMRTVERRHAAFKNLLRGASGPEAANDALLRGFRNGRPALFGHGRRVARVASSLARALHLSHEEVAIINGAALLHDAGKLSLPEAVLLGEEPIGDSELEALLDHHSRTMDLLSAEPALAAITDLVDSIHESWDGSGYPEGTCGRVIPLGARIIAVADVLDAARAWSVSGEAPSQECVAAALRREAGVRLDPDLVRVCLHAMDGQTCL